MENTENSLAGLTILVTRPKELAGSLAELIKHAGGMPCLYPVITIEKPALSAQTMKALEKLDAFDIAIFISPTAVRMTFKEISQLPTTIAVAAIGSSTLAALEKNGIKVSIQPSGHDSESLLTHPLLQEDSISGKAIIIFRGEGGREQLGNQLKSRGASVDYAEMYRRTISSTLPSLTNAELDELNMITITSNEGLQNLVNLTLDQAKLTQIPLLVPGSRAETLAKQLGFKTIIKADDATDSAYMRALNKWATIINDNK